MKYQYMFNAKNNRTTVDVCMLINIMFINNINC